MGEDRFGNLMRPYVLGEFPAEEEREMDRHLGRCPRCRSVLEDVRRAHGMLCETVIAYDAPPPDLKEWVLARARSESGGEARSEARSRRPAAGRRLLATAAAAVLVVAVLGVFWTVGGGGPSRGLPLTATATAPGASGEISGEEAGENLRVELEVRDLPELRAGEYYEMWYVKEGVGRISCGTFGVGPEGDATVKMSAPESTLSYPEIEVTRERDDGDPATSGDKVLVGSLRDL